MLSILLLTGQTTWHTFTINLKLILKKKLFHKSTRPSSLGNSLELQRKLVEYRQFELPVCQVQVNKEF